MPLKRLPHVESQAILGCTAGETVSKKLNVVGGRTLEVCAVSLSIKYLIQQYTRAYSRSCQSQFWNSLPSADVSMEIHFHGLTVLQGTELNIVGGSELLKLQVESKVRLEAWSPHISFGELNFVVRAKASS